VKRQVAAVALLLAAVLASCLPTLTYPMGRDQAFYACGGWVILRGGVPGIDWLALAPPGTAYLCALSQILFGHTQTAIRWLDLLWTVATALSLAALGSWLLGRRAGFLAGALWAWSYGANFDFWNSAQVDGFLTLPTVGVLALAWRGLERRAAWWWIAAGALLAQAFMIKYIALALGLPLAAMLWSSRRPWGATRGVIVPLLWTALGFAVGLAPWIALMLAQGSLGTLLEAQSGMRVGYTSLASSWKWMRPGLFWFLVSFTGLMIFSLVGLLALRRRSSPVGALVVGWFMAAAVAYAAQRKFFPYHSLPLLAPLALLAALGAVWIVDSLRSMRAVRQPPVAWAAVLALFAVSQVLAFQHWAEAWGDAVFVLGPSTREDLWRQLRPRLSSSVAANMDLAERIRAESSPTDTIFLWGSEPLVHFLAERPAPGRFWVNTWLMAPWGDPAWHGELIASLRERRPSHIVVCRGDAVPWVTGHGKSSEDLLAGFDDLRRLIEEDFQPAWQTPLFRVYRRRAATPEGVTR
jgi:4-amino-4-deoxy-L-arabinose transferase-like glycosyltransferase